VSPLLALDLFAQAKPPAGPNLGDLSTIWIVVIAVAVLFFIVFAFIFFSFVQLWIQSIMTGANIGIGSLIGMKLRKVDYQPVAALRRATWKAITSPAGMCRRRLQPLSRRTRPGLICRGKPLRPSTSPVAMCSKRCERA
jgi:SigmaW regulon antibacterial